MKDIVRLRPRLVAGLGLTILALVLLVASTRGTTITRPNRSAGAQAHVARKRPTTAADVVAKKRSTAAAALVANRRPTTVDAYVTYYGWYDNTPPGCVTAYGSGCARGRGTYSNPITFASDVHEFPVGTIVYYPSVEKYFRMGDDCSECDADWKGRGPDGGPGLHHLDLWIGGKGGKEWDAIRCEDALTQVLPNGTPLQTPVVVNPPAGLPTSTQPLFNTRTGQCYGGARSQTYYGRYENRQTHECLRAESRHPGAPAVAAPCSKAPDEDLGFDGAFLSVGKLCLATKGQHNGAGLWFVPCSGHRHQLWETGSGGTISTIQQLNCIAEVNGVIQLAGCKTSATNRQNQWTFVPERPARVIG